MKQMRTAKQLLLLAIFSIEIMVIVAISLVNPRFSNLVQRIPQSIAMLDLFILPIILVIGLFISMGLSSFFDALFVRCLLLGIPIPMLLLANPSYSRLKNSLARGYLSLWDIFGALLLLLMFLFRYEIRKEIKGHEQDQRNKEGQTASAKMEMKIFPLWIESVFVGICLITLLLIILFGFLLHWL